MKTIVVGYDDTEPAKRALKRGAELAEALGAKLVVTSVASVQHGVGLGRTGPLDPTDTPEMHSEELKSAAAMLQELGVEAEYVRAIGEPAETIVELADQREADMIIIGARDLGVVQRMIGQRVSTVVTRQAHSDVLIVH